MISYIDKPNTKGLRTPPKQYKANTLYWNAYQKEILNQVGSYKLSSTDEGGLRITSPKLAASIMNDVYTGKTIILENLYIKPAD